MRPQERLRANLASGKVYRRSELALWSTSVDRQVAALVKDGTLKKVGPGLYLRPKQTPFGESVGATDDLVRAFLKDDRFLVLSYNSYNSLGLGTTQLYNHVLVYNHKRHGKFALGGVTYEFKMKPTLPTALTREFLLVDMLNNLDELAEDKERVLDLLKKKFESFDSKSVEEAARLYGKVKTKKLVQALLNGQKVSSPRH